LVLSSSLLFFATTNFAVWAFSGMYAHDLHGLVLCYVAALPFLWNTVAGDMLWTALLFATWWSAKFLLAPSELQYGRQIRSAPSRSGGRVYPTSAPLSAELGQARVRVGRRSAASTRRFTPSATTDRARPS